MAVHIGTSLEETVLEAAGLSSALHVTSALVGSSESDDPPVVLVLPDADLFFHSVVGMAASLQPAGEIPPSIVVVGLGYGFDALRTSQTQLGEFLNRRSQDYLTVTVDLTAVPRRMTSPTGGNAQVLLDVVVDSVLPVVRAQYKVPEGPQAIMGHSGSGHFALYAGLRRPDIFNRVIAGTPVVYSYERFEKLASQWAVQAAAANSRLFIGTGSLDPSMYRSDIDPLAEYIKSVAPEGAVVTAHEFTDETHSSVYSSVFSRGLRTVLGDFMPGVASEAMIRMNTANR